MKKNTHKLREGDVVMLMKPEVSNCYPGPPVGSTGVVMFILDKERPGVRWDKRFTGGHTGNSRDFCEHGHGWYVDARKLRYLGKRVNPATVQRERRIVSSTRST